MLSQLSQHATIVINIFSNWKTTDLTQEVVALKV